MTVQELIELLMEFDPEAKVWLTVFEGESCDSALTSDHVLEDQAEGTVTFGVLREAADDE